jgi:hypothetical protein
MNKIKDIFIGLGLSTFVLVLWVYKMLVTSDIPVEMFYKDSVIITCMLVLFLIIYSVYTRKTKYILMNRERPYFCVNLKNDKNFNWKLLWG